MADTPLLTNKPWDVAGISRASWYRLASAGKTPKPVATGLSRRRYRVADVVAWVERMRTDTAVRTGPTRWPAAGDN